MIKKLVYQIVCESILPIDYSDLIKSRIPNKILNDDKNIYLLYKVSENDDVVVLIKNLLEVDCKEKNIKITTDYSDYRITTIKKEKLDCQIFISDSDHWQFVSDINFIDCKKASIDIVEYINSFDKKKVLGMFNG